MTATISGSATSTLVALTTTGNTILGDASTDTLNVGNGDLVKDASGNVGIGTSSPGAKLDVGYVAGNVALRVSRDASNRLDFYQGGGVSYVDSSPVGGVLAFATAGTERARIDSSGNLLVGTTSAFTGVYTGIPSVQISRIGSAQGYVGIQTTVTTAGDLVQFVNPNGLVGHISVSGSATAYITSSDYRLKNTVAPMMGALGKVMLLKPCIYKWNVDGSDGQGFIAHELAEVVPECVVGEKDAVNEDGSIKAQGIDTSFLVATLTAAIQELKVIVDTQAARITALEGANNGS
jgi:hypothetical protein